MLIAGWKTRSMLDRYNITDKGDIQEAGAKMARFEEEQATGAAAAERSYKRSYNGEPNENTESPQTVKIQ
jgi:hypothetical protein